MPSEDLAIWTALTSAARATSVIRDLRARTSLGVRVSVSVDHPAPNEVLWRENWARVRPPLPGGVARAWSVLRWRLDGSTLHLSHERFTPAHPTPLVAFDLSRIDPGADRWSLDALAPHPCGPDAYHATLASVRPGTLDLAWRIVGPATSLTIRTRYRCAPARETVATR